MNEQKGRSSLDYEARDGETRLAPFHEGVWSPLGICLTFLFALLLFAAFTLYVSYRHSHG